MEIALWVIAGLAAAYFALRLSLWLLFNRNQPASLREQSARRTTGPDDIHRAFTTRGAPKRRGKARGDSWQKFAESYASVCNARFSASSAAISLLAALVVC